MLEIAKENAEKAGIADRYSILPGSAFEVDFGTGYDVVLLTNFLHHFDSPTCEKLLRKIRASLKPNGKLATLEAIPDESKTSPEHPVLFSLIMLVSTEGGDAYTYKELEQMFFNAGFSWSVISAVILEAHGIAELIAGRNRIRPVRSTNCAASSGSERSMPCTETKMMRFVT